MSGLRHISASQTATRRRGCSPSSTPAPSRKRWTVSAAAVPAPLACSLCSWQPHPARVARPATANAAIAAAGTRPGQIPASRTPPPRVREQVQPRDDEQRACGRSAYRWAGQETLASVRREARPNRTFYLPGNIPVEARCGTYADGMEMWTMTISRRLSLRL